MAKYIRNEYGDICVNRNINIHIFLYLKTCLLAKNSNNFSENLDRLYNATKRLGIKINAWNRQRSRINDHKLHIKSKQENKQTKQNPRANR